MILEDYIGKAFSFKIAMIASTKNYNFKYKDISIYTNTR